MRILIVAPRVPWPALDGGRIAMGRLAESLMRAGADVSILSLNPRKHRANGHAPVPIETVDIDTSRHAFPAWRAMTSSTPFVVARFQSRRFRDALRAALRRFDPDIVQIESPFMLPYVPVIRDSSDARVVLRSLNVEFRIWEGLARVERNPLRRAAFRQLARSLRRFELAETRRVDGLVPISNDDAEEFKRLGVDVKVHVAPCSASVERNGADHSERNSVGFIGSLDYEPNRDAVRWILDELWPRVIAAVPQAKLAIAGSSPPSWLLQRSGVRRVTVHPNVRDASSFVRSQSVFIAPLFAGGGMRIKVLDAMTLGRPVVATTLGCGGIDVRAGEDVVIADDVDGFAAEVVRLLADPADAQRKGSAARAMIARRYCGDGIARDLLRFYETL